LEAGLTEVLLRPAIKTDFPAIKTLIHASRINPNGLDWRRFTVAETPEGQFIGCGQLKPHSAGILELASLAVIPSQRGKGIARLLIQKLTAEAPRPLYLTCRSQLGPFYEKFGFRGISGQALPKYYQRLSRIAGLIHALHLIDAQLLVMVLEKEEAR
jgi:N-acetylglutamate synthase-like GNAT family acetyltransferase